MSPSAEYQRQWRAARGARTGHPGRPVSRPCGTVAAYKRHLRHNEHPCMACRTANATYHRDRYNERKRPTR